MTTRRIILLGCAKRKRQGSWPARDLYDSTLWHARLRYAERTGDPWFVFSALYGLVAPDDVISWYDRTMSDLSADDRRALGRRVVEDLEQRTGSLADVRVEVHAGQRYVDTIGDELVKRGALVVQPLAGVAGIGPQIRRYGEMSGPEWSVDPAVETGTTAMPRGSRPRIPSARSYVRPASATETQSGDTSARKLGGKYELLQAELSARPSPAHMTFREIDRLVGGLPPSARRHRAWWANDPSHVHARAWLDIARRVTSVDFSAEVVEFS